MMEELIQPGIVGRSGAGNLKAWGDPDATAKARSAEAMGSTGPTTTSTYLSPATLPQ